MHEQQQNDSWPVGADTLQEALIRQQISEQGITEELIAGFRALVYHYYHLHRRELPWRVPGDPYRVLVSEVMLQQTQVDRVIPKFLAFVEYFPSTEDLSVAPLATLLSAWQGLGYNRRALNLQRAARQIVDCWQGVVPDDTELLKQLPGIGPYTAGAIRAFAFNRPELFLETNIRSVLLHFFFPGQEQVADRELLPVAEALLDRVAPRDWYNALMDYGSDLKRRFPNPSRRSRHHTVQSRFHGSDRQIRGGVLRHLLTTHGLTLNALVQRLNCDKERLRRILAALVGEGLVQQTGTKFQIPSAVMQDRR